MSVSAKTEHQSVQTAVNLTSYPLKRQDYIRPAVFCLSATNINGGLTTPVLENTSGVLTGS